MKFRRARAGLRRDHCHRRLSRSARACGDCGSPSRRSDRTAGQGRILDDLRRVAGDLRFVDAVVAENGAIVVYPATGHSMVLGCPPPAAFVDQLRQCQIEITVGACVVEAQASDAHRVLTVVREMELPLMLLLQSVTADDPA